MLKDEIYINKFKKERPEKIKVNPCSLLKLMTLVINSRLIP
jgi:hypothetical protein